MSSTHVDDLYQRNIRHSTNPRFLLFSLHVIHLISGTRASFPRCWRKADILPAVVQADPDQDVGKATAEHKDTLYELAGLVQRLSLGAEGRFLDDDICEALGGLGLAPGARPSQASMAVVLAWTGVEEIKDVALAMVEDLKEDFFAELFAPPGSDSDDGDANPTPVVQGGASSADSSPFVKPFVLPRPPPYADVADDFGSLEEIAEKCHMPTVSYYLRKAKLAWMSDFGARKSK